MAKLKSITLSEDQDSPQEIGGETYHCWKFTNPQGAQVRCEAVAGKGEISLYKNNTKIGLPYQISSDPGHPTAIHLNTGNWVDAVTVTLQEGDTLLKIARRWGVPIKWLITMNPSITKSDLIYPGQVLRIPPSQWEVWIKEIEPAKPGKSKFKVKLLSE